MQCFVGKNMFDHRCDLIDKNMRRLFGKVEVIFNEKCVGKKKELSLLQTKYQARWATANMLLDLLC